MKKVTKRIPEKTYKKIHSLIPVPCVDVLITDGRGNFLLAKRKNNPEKGKWFFPGGRVLRGEKIKDTALRKLKQEARLKGKIVELLGVYDFFSKEGYFKNIPTHTIAIVFLVKVSGGQRIILDQQNSESAWFNKINPKWHPYVKKFLKEAGFK